MTAPAGAPAAPPAPTTSIPATPRTDYVPPVSQEDFDAIIEKRLARERSRYADYDDIKAKAARADALEAELGSESDKAAKAARDEERAKAKSEWTPRVVRAEFKAEAARRGVSASQLDALLEDLDLSKYVSDKGDVDEDRVAKKLDAVKPATDARTIAPPRSLGQGNHQQSQGKKGDAGRAMAEKRFGSKQQ